MDYRIVASCLTHVNERTESDFTDADKAYGYAETMTTLGFEAEVKRIDGETLTVIVTR